MSVVAEFRIVRVASEQEYEEQAPLQSPSAQLLGKGREWPCREGGRHFPEECSRRELSLPTLGLEGAGFFGKCCGTKNYSSVLTHTNHMIIGPRCLHLHTWETEARQLSVCDQPGLHSETLAGP